MNSFYCKHMKRLLDVCLAALAMVVFSPFFIVLMVVLAFANRGNPFFVQERPGKNGKIFRLLKFKTLNDETDAEGNLLPDHQRIFKVGRFVRSTSLDEIPQLINVLKGDMSLVGPRPLLIQYMPLYNEQQHRRHEVRPGITGWAQVNGRNAISWSQKFGHDIWYVDRCSFLMDLKILLMTVRKILTREGISSRSSATMEPFRGNLIDDE